MSENDDISRWSKILDRRPIRVVGETDAEKFASELEERLDALLGLNKCDATHEGWRTLAIRLALKHEKAFQTDLPLPEKKKGARAPPLGVTKGTLFTAACEK